MAQERDFTQLSATEAFFNRLVGFLVKFGIGPGHMRVLEVRGRKTGRIYRTPVDLLPLDGRFYLVAPRGKTQWVRNAEAQGEVNLRRGARVDTYKLRVLSADEKPPVLKAYLDNFKAEVQGFFTVKAGSDEAAFVPLADHYPAFELLAT